MDDTRRRLGLRALLGAIAVLLVTVVFASAALAGGGSTSNEQPGGDSPAAANVQSESEPDRDCPDGRRASDSSTAL